MPSRKGAVRLFSYSGITVFIHWSWFLVAVFEIQRGSYSSALWNVLEYLALFVIVMLHEFGHALACRQVGGRADTIVLWPLGGVAYVDPPPRPGATLWSIAAGPLVNVLLVPALLVLASFGHSLEGGGNLSRLLDSIYWLNKWLLVFNILPVYPLDGGQILRSLLWFVMGRARSLMVAAILGVFAVIGFFGLALAGFFGQDIWRNWTWYGILAVFIWMNCWGGLQHARALFQLAKIPRRQGYACPTCQNSPPIGEYWKCGNCHNAFDTFATGAVCPHCGARYEMTRCIDCGRQHPLAEWMGQTILTPQT